MSTAILTGAPVPGSSLADDLRSLGFDVQVAADVTEAARLLSAVPADRRVALVDPRFVGHVHALRLGLTDPRFPAATVPGALTAQPEARPALVRALDTTAEAVGAGVPDDDERHPGVLLHSDAFGVRPEPEERARELA
ncbi:CDP-alcohol phosphatidyltransferase family protein, partial [Streptomyces sp. NPDC006510]